MRAKPNGLAAGALGLTGQGHDVLCVLRHRLGQRGSVARGGLGGHGGIAAGDIALRAKLPGGGACQEKGSGKGDRHRMPPQQPRQPQDRAAHHR